jgi:hypothetical protein
MRVLHRYLSAVLWDNLGNCSICIRTAFQTAAAGWGLTLLFAALGWSQLLLLSIVGAITLTSLWMAHLLVHARKITILAEREDKNQSTTAVSRRAVLPLFVRTLGAAAVLSATPAFAQPFPCTAGTGSCQQDGCPECTRPCYVRGSTGLPGCIKCTGCGSNCTGWTC